MKHKLTSREIILIVLLIVLGGGAAYYWFWYKPVTTDIDTYNAQALEIEDQILVAQNKTVELARMKAELKTLFGGGKAPVSMATYDNLKPLMKELNVILRNTQNFSITFDIADDNNGVVRRAVSINYTTPTYAEAIRIINDLHNSKYRSLIKTLALTAHDGALWPGKEIGPAATASVKPDADQPDTETAEEPDTAPVEETVNIQAGGPGTNSEVSVTMTLIFYEYNENYVPEPTPAPENAENAENAEGGDASQYAIAALRN